MENYRYQKSFAFSNSVEEVASMLRSCVEYIEEPKEISPVPVTDKLRIQWALTELLINGAKHPGTQESHFHFKLGENVLTIEKEDYGYPLTLKVDAGSTTLLWPADKSSLKRDFEVYRNGMDSLRIHIDSIRSAFFTVLELETVEMPELLSTTSEHFGLMIIAKASDHFSYHFDEELKRNVFTVTFNLLKEL